MVQNGFSIKLTLKFLKRIKSNSDKGTPTSIEDIQIYYKYQNRQFISGYLDTLEENGLITSYKEGGQRFSNITPKGVDFLYELVCSLLSPLEQMVIKTLRTDGKVQTSYRLIGPLMMKHLKKSLSEQRQLIKDAILKECEEHDVPEKTMENIMEAIYKILTESSVEFVETNFDESTFL